MSEQFNFSKTEIERLRELAKKKAEIANDPVNLERKQAWYNLDSGNNSRVMVLAEHMGVVDRKLPVPNNLQCRNQWAQRLEMKFLNELYQFEELKDDHVIEPILHVPFDLDCSGYGVEKVVQQTDSDVAKGAINWESPIKDLDKDFEKLKPRTYSINRESSIAKKDFLASVFSGIIEVENQQSFWWTLGMTNTIIDLIGLEPLMLYMFDNPEGLHRIMAFLRDDCLAFARWLEKEGFLCLNNKNDYTGSGSIGYTRDLPQSDYVDGEKVRMQDQWVLLESQETVLVGPEHFAEFVFPYQNDIAREFGKVYYGCCEPVNNRWHVLEKMENLSRVSVSPWCDETFMAEALAGKYVYSRKPNPALISTEIWDEDAIRKDIRTTLDTAKNCRLEIIMKDVHTLSNHPERLPQWVEIVRKEIAR